MKQHDKPFPRGILFDMDGVLLVTSQSPAQSWQEACQQFAPLLDISVETLVQALQESRNTYKHEIEQDAEKQRRDRLQPFETRLETVENALKALNRANKQIATEMVRAYETFSDAHRHLAPHALDVLQILRERSFALALLSNGNATYQRRKIAHYGLAPFFDVILIEEEFGVEKPNARIFLHALDRLHVTAQQAWMIGDDLARDIAGAQQVGIFAVWCDFDKKGLPDNNAVRPDWIIHDLSEVSEILYPQVTKSVMFSRD
ncbi:MAG TPA: HAD family hydrolase [Ktedonobacteraceae bacterium]|jgi:putative hydrolase of the HAD superfamily|nr:HAD family hydrolase [Ktedonobacteraceae bacterium]